MACSLFSTTFLIGGSIALLIVLIGVLASVCLFCRCCLIYKHRKRRLMGGASVCHSNSFALTSRPPSYAINYSVCPHLFTRPFTEGQSTL